MRRAGGPARRARSAPPVSLARPASIRAPHAPVWAAPLWPCPARPFARPQAPRVGCAPNGESLARITRRRNARSRIVLAPIGLRGLAPSTSGRECGASGARTEWPNRREESAKRTCRRACGRVAGRARASSAIIATAVAAGLTRVRAVAGPRPLAPNGGFAHDSDVANSCIGGLW